MSTGSGEPEVSGFVGSGCRNYYGFDRSGLQCVEGWFGARRFNGFGGFNGVRGFRGFRGFRGIGSVGGAGGFGRARGVCEAWAFDFHSRG